MAALRGSSRISKFIGNNLLLRQRGISTSKNLGAAWNKDWMPDQELPQTPDETKKVAEKYNIPPELYKPHKNPYGDYPDLGTVSEQQRDANYPWDDPVNRRDWGEFVDLRYSFHSEDRCDPHLRNRTNFDGKYAAAAFCFFFFGWLALWFWAEQYPLNRDIFDKQYPYNNKRNDYVSASRHVLVGNYDRVIHYTFEPATKE